MTSCPKRRLEIEEQSLAHKTQVRLPLEWIGQAPSFGKRGGSHISRHRKSYALRKEIGDTHMTRYPKKARTPSKERPCEVSLNSS